MLNLNSHYYNETIRKTIVVFGNLFTGLTIKSRDNNGAVARNIVVPISFARKQQWLQRLQGDPNFQKKFEVEIPRLSFEIESYQYYPEKKIGNQHERMIQQCGLPKALGAPVPYRLIISLSAYSKNQDDALQILEQILPYFSPALTVSIKPIEGFNFTLDIPISLQGVSEEDNYQDLGNNRMIIHTFQLAVDVQLFGPTDEDVNLIKKTIMNVSMNPQQETDIVGTNEVIPDTANKTDTHTIESLWTVL